MAASLTSQTTGTEAGTVNVTVGSGERIIITLRERDGSTVSASSSLDGALTQVVTSAAVAARASIFYLQSPSVGTHTITVSGGSVRDFNVQVWAGLQNAAADTSNSATNSSTTSHSHGAVTPSASALIITAMGATDTGGTTPHTGFTALNIDGLATTNRQFYAYKAGHTGAITPTHTTTTTASSDAVVAAFLEATGGVEAWLPQIQMTSGRTWRAVASGAAGQD